MPIKTRECPISELETEILKKVKSILDEDEEPLFCYETEVKESGTFGGIHYFHVIVVTRFEIIKLFKNMVSGGGDSYLILFLSEIAFIQEDEDSSKHPEIGIYSVGTQSVYSQSGAISFTFENKSTLYTFTRKLRHAIANAK